MPCYCGIYIYICIFIFTKFSLAWHPYGSDTCNCLVCSFKKIMKISHKLCILQYFTVFLFFFIIDFLFKN